MTNYQEAKIEELESLGWTLQSKEFVPGAAHNGGSYIFKMTVGESQRAYICQNYIQHYN